MHMHLVHAMKRKMAHDYYLWFCWRKFRSRGAGCQRRITFAMWSAPLFGATLAQDMGTKSSPPNGVVSREHLVTVVAVLTTQRSVI